VFEIFNGIATIDACVVLDDALCPKDRDWMGISHDSKTGIYQRLGVEALWSPDKYREMIEQAGYALSTAEDLTVHCEMTYQWLHQSALQLGEEQLAEAYEKTIAGIREGDFGWAMFVATRQGKESVSVDIVEKQV